ncbi:unnamed protein product [Closterium sp. NIES-54]
MHSRLLVSGLPRSLPPLPPSPAPPCLPCVEGQQRAAPHPSSFPPTTSPLQTLHSDVWGPASVSGQGHERYFLLVVDDSTRYTTVFPLRIKGEVPDVLIPWIRAVRLQLCERFRQDLLVLRVHTDRGGEFSSDLLRDFCRGEGIFQSFMLPAYLQQNGIAERRIGLVMEVACTSMFHAAAPRFLWPFEVRYAVHQLNLWPRVSLPETSPSLRWTGKVGDAPVFRVWGSHAFVCNTSADKLSASAIPCNVTFDESVPFYHLFPYRSAPLPPPPLFLYLGPPSVDPLPPRGLAPSGVSQVDPFELVEVAVESCAAGVGATRGVVSGGSEPAGVGPGGTEPACTEPGVADSKGAELGGAEPERAEPGGAELGGAEPEHTEPGGTFSTGGPLGALSRQEPLSPLHLREWFARRTRLRSGAAVAAGSAAEGTGTPGLGGTGAARAGGAARVGAGGTGARAAGDTGAAGPGGARTRGTGAARAGGAAGVGARGTGAGAAGGTGAGASRGVGAGDPGAGDTGAGGAGPGGAGAVGVGTGDTGQPRPYFVPLLQQVLGLTSSTGLTPPYLFPPPDKSQPPLQPASPLPAPSPYTEQTGGLTERRELVFCPALPVRVVRTGRRVPRKRPPPVTSTHHMALHSSSVPQRDPLPSPLASSLADGLDPLCDVVRAATPTVARLLATVVTDPLFEYAVASALVAELVDFAAACLLDYIASLVAKFESDCPPSVWGASRWHDTLRTTLAALGIAPSTTDPSMFRRTDTSLPPFYVLVYIYDLAFTTADTEAMTLVKSELRKRHTCTYLGELRSYLGLQITRDRVLQRFRFRYSSPQSTPLPTGHSLSAPPSDESVEPSGLYPELVGCLMYLMTCTLSDLAYPLSILARYVAPRRHQPEHSEVAKRVLRYLCSTSGMGLVLGGRGSVVLTGHVDASWVEDLATQRSSQGYTFSLGSGCRAAPPSPSRPPATTAAAAAAAAALATAAAAAAPATAAAGGGAAGSTRGAAGAGGAGPTTDRHCMSWPLSRQLRWLGVDSSGHCLSRTTPPLNSFVKAAALGSSESAVAPGAGESAAALGARESANALGASVSTATVPASTEALQTFTLDSGASCCFFRDCTIVTPLAAPVPASLADPTGGPIVTRASTVLLCPAVPSGSLSGLHLPAFSTNLLINTVLHDEWVDTFIPGGQGVAICKCSQIGRHLATFTRQPGSGLYTLTTASSRVAESGQVAALSRVSASGQLAVSCSCRVLSLKTLLWHHRLGHPSLPRLRSMHSRLLISGLPRSLPSLPCSPAPPGFPCFKGQKRAAPHSSEFPPTTSPL